LSRAAIVGAVATAGVLLFAIPALAHITVTSSSAAPGSAAELTFHVPNEEARADTVRVDIQIPTDHPIAQLLVRPIPGWTASVRTTTLAKPLVTDDGQFTQVVSEVVWSGGRIAPSQFQDFAVSADPLPQGVSQLTFKTIQTYSNGDVVRWIDVPQPGQPAPDHPAPMLTLTTGTATTGGSAATSGTAPSPAATATSGSDGMARVIAIAGVAVGLLGLALAGLGWRRGNAAARMEPPEPTLNGHALAMAPAGQPEPRNEAGRQRSQRPVPEPRGGGTAGRETPRRKGTSGRRPHR
jgi:uncharacterized protein YcnI